jgi:hypothetical protein
VGVGLLAIAGIIAFRHFGNNSVPENQTSLPAITDEPSPQSVERELVPNPEIVQHQNTISRLMNLQNQINAPFTLEKCSKQFSGYNSCVGRNNAKTGGVLDRSTADFVASGGGFLSASGNAQLRNINEIRFNKSIAGDKTDFIQTEIDNLRQKISLLPTEISI